MSNYSINKRQFYVERCACDCRCWNTYLIGPGVIWVIAAPVLVTIVVSTVAAAAAADDDDYYYYYGYF